MDNEIPLERLLERLERARKHYKQQNIKEFRGQIFELGETIHNHFANVQGVFSVGYPHYTLNNHVPLLLMKWFEGKLGFVLEKAHGIDQKIIRAYEAAREDIDLYLVTKDEDKVYAGKSFGEIDQRKLLFGETSVIDTRALNNLVYEHSNINLYAYEDIHADKMVVDLTIIPSTVWDNLLNSPSEWQDKKKWGTLGIDILFSMVNLSSDPNLDRIDEFRYQVIQSQEGETLSKKIDNLRFTKGTSHSELLKDPVVHCYWKMRLLESYTNHQSTLK